MKRVLLCCIAMVCVLAADVWAGSAASVADQGGRKVVPLCVPVETVQISFSVMNSDNDIKKLTESSQVIVSQILDMAKQVGVTNPVIENYNYNVMRNEGGYNRYDDNMGAYRMSMQGSLKLDDSKNMAELVSAMDQKKMRPNLRVSSRNNCNYTRH